MARGPSRRGEGERAAQQALRSPGEALRYFSRKSERYGPERAMRLTAAALVALTETARAAANLHRLEMWKLAVNEGRLTAFEPNEELEFIPESDRDAVRQLAAFTTMWATTVGSANVKPSESASPVKASRRHRKIPPRMKASKNLADPKLAFAAVLAAAAHEYDLRSPTPTELMFLAVGVDLDPPTDQPSAYRTRLRTWGSRLKRATPLVSLLVAAARRDRR
jgi:hypothetical protein